MTTVRTDNDFMVCANRSTIQSLMPLMIQTRQQGYRVAAYILAMCEILPDETEPSTFDEVNDAIRNT